MKPSFRCDSTGLVYLRIALCNDNECSLFGAHWAHWELASLPRVLFMTHV